MQSILSTDYYIHCQKKAYKELTHYLEDNFHSKIFVLVDSNTKKYCLPHFKKSLIQAFDFEVLGIEPGEELKNINTCIKLWNQLTELKADRKSLLINLGGGVITDMGGFVASTFKRGFDFINIPTTLLSMVDASVGSMTGVDLGVMKNQIGLFSNPEMVLIDPEFLRTVTNRQLRSGLAEIIKYGFTFDKSLWEKIKTFDKIDHSMADDLIYRSIQIKNDVVLQDLKESKLRKTLNFGHTVGHAIESYFLENEDKKALTHGESVAAGMVIESYYSAKINGFSMNITDELKQFTHRFFGKIDLKEEDFKEIIDMMIYDKKNVGGQVFFVLLNKMENCSIDMKVPDDLILEGLNYYIN
jgi:3-dehydroquinate synthase